MAIVNITRGQYRAFAEIAKANGCVLGLSTVEEMNCFGRINLMATGVVQDAADNNSRLIEKSVITLARSIDTDLFRSATRPELDWAQLEDHEIFPLLLWHEIGHKVDNFDALLVAFARDSETRTTCLRHVATVNEVLADRFAWNKVRPGKPIPVGDTGKRLQGRIAIGLEYLRKHAVHTSIYTIQPLPAGQYRRSQGNAARALEGAIRRDQGCRCLEGGEAVSDHPEHDPDEALRHKVEAWVLIKEAHAGGVPWSEIAPDEPWMQCSRKVAPDITHQHNHHVCQA